MPEGYTIDYRPRVSLIEGLSYRLDIYDRWGKRLFRTTDPFGAWNGRGPGGAIAPAGIYLAVVELEEEGAEAIRVVEQVTVVR